MKLNLTKYKEEFNARWAPEFDPYVIDSEKLWSFFENMAQEVARESFSKGAASTVVEAVYLNTAAIREESVRGFGRFRTGQLGLPETAWDWEIDKYLSEDAASLIATRQEVKRKIKQQIASWEGEVDG